MSIRSAAVFAFQPSDAGRPSVSNTAPDPGRSGPDTLPDREWGLSATQVLGIVVAIVAACELFGLVL